MHEYNKINIFEPRGPLSDNFHKSPKSQTKARAIPKVAVAYTGYYGINKNIFHDEKFYYHKPWYKFSVPSGCCLNSERGQYPFLKKFKLCFLIKSKWFNFFNKGVTCLPLPYFIEFSGRHKVSNRKTRSLVLSLTRWILYVERRTGYTLFNNWGQSKINSPKTHYCIHQSNQLAEYSYVNHAANLTTIPIESAA